MLLERAVADGEHLGETLRLRGLVLLRLGQLDEAGDDLEAAAVELGDHAPCHRELGVTRLRQGRYREAVESLDRCLWLEMDDALAHAVRAGALLRLGRTQEALESISAAIALEPDDAGHLHNRAVVLTALHRHREAVQDYEHVLWLDPNSAGTMNNLAWLLATTPDPTLRDGPRALDLARRAVALDPTGAWLDTLAAAQAESGDFDAAILTEAKALEQSVLPNPAFQKRLRLYRQGKTDTSPAVRRSRIWEGDLRRLYSPLSVKNRGKFSA